MGTGCGWTSNSEQLHCNGADDVRRWRCGWTSNSEQLHSLHMPAPVISVAAGPRILNSYTGGFDEQHNIRVAAGPRILNSYTFNIGGALLGCVAAGPRILNSYT